MHADFINFLLLKSAKYVYKQNAEDVKQHIISGYTITPRLQKIYKQAFHTENLVTPSFLSSQPEGESAETVVQTNNKTEYCSQFPYVILGNIVLQDFISESERKQTKQEKLTQWHLGVGSRYHSEQL